MGTRTVITGVLILAVVATLASEAPAQAPTRPGRTVQWKFTLDFIVQGPQAPFILAAEKGYYAQEGLQVTIDRGFGSADAVTKIASGAYHLGYADINSMIEFNARNPGRDLVAIAIVLNEPPFSIITLRREGITRPIELYGKRLGAPAGDAPRRLWPLFARAVGMDPRAVEWVTMDVPLREPMLIRGEVNAISGFYFTSFINLKAARVDPSDIVAFMYSEQGLPLYGNAIMAPPALLQSEPEAVRGFLRAFVRALKDTIANPQEAVAAVRRRDPLLREDVELERLLLALRLNMLTRDVRAHGFGAARGDRLARSIDLLAEAFAFPRKPVWQQVFTDRFLPPRAERMLPAARP
ncbi:MAG: ABC transporter substrate-binding protein [Armatimonadota bacterium]|nr:ABC transporter substrate-binding protein [Armatimonadota bacterium]MDR7485911.1 ABC transporter substrate-binding protein [Armatimonadota bacterium]MDR7533138.1 ABC transporter substrate-binding protein [Armatimonadota bacterium]MDR7536616.1 ABC transporter substrate-binding protein [Armatimonadota bacterium]